MSKNERKMLELIGFLFFTNTENEAKIAELEAEKRAIEKSMNYCIEENNRLCDELNAYENLRPIRSRN